MRSRREEFRLEKKTQPRSRPQLSFQNKGEATAGKTQLCLRLLLTAQLPQKLGGLDGSALWLCSEKGDPPVRRLAQLARGGEKKSNNNQNRPPHPPLQQPQ